MKDRISLHNMLLELTPNVYYQEPSNTKMRYPAIVYKLKNVNKTLADNNPYKIEKVYDVTVIDSDPDSDIVDRLLEKTYSQFDRRFALNGLTNTTIQIYY